MSDRGLTVSVIIPAFNAAGTLAEALDSLLAQTWPHWEAIIVDDGSEDSTPSIAEAYARRDPRFQVVRQPHQGVSASRNAGVEMARRDWILFLDADDWLLPNHLERMTGALAQETALDGVYCGWTRVTPNGEHHTPEIPRRVDDLFTSFAFTCVFVIHGCLFRRSLARSIGGFDAELKTCEDWDLWQRIARTGARLQLVPEALARYRLRSESASMDGRRLLDDGLRVIQCGHAADPRVTDPHPDYARGRDPAELPSAMYRFACWAAGLEAGQGRDPLPLLQRLESTQAPSLAPQHVAQILFHSVPLPACRLITEWSNLWPEASPILLKFLEALEAQSRVPGLARSSRLVLERLVLKHATGSKPWTLGLMRRIQVEVTEPIVDVKPSASVEQIFCVVTLEGDVLGEIEIPVCDRLAPASVISDQIAVKFAWRILARFFERHIYPGLRLERIPEGLAVSRNEFRLTVETDGDKEDFLARAHERIGWHVFLQEIWGRPQWPARRFYNPDWRDYETRRRHVENDWEAVEISEPLPTLEASAEEIDVILLVGGFALGMRTLRPSDHVIHAQEILAAFTSASGFELCRVAVREGLIGKPLSDPTTLRERLRQAAASAGWGDEEHRREFLDRQLPVDDDTVILARRQPRTFGTSDSRRARLPAAAVSKLLKMAEAAGEPVVRKLPQKKNSGIKLKTILYAPEVIRRAPPRNTPARSLSPKTNVKPRVASDVYGRHHFESLFASGADPWDYTNAYEQTKYEHTLSLLPETRPQRALELACAEGHFTVQLAPRVDQLVAADISEIALRRAAQRCAEARLDNVRFARLDLQRDPLEEDLDLIVCSEVLYYFSAVDDLKAFAQKIAAALKPGGHFLTAHANVIADEPDRPGFNWNLPYGAKVIGEVLGATPQLRLAAEVRTPIYRVQLFQRESEESAPSAREIPRVTEFAEQPVLPPPEVAAHIRWQGGSPSRPPDPPEIKTDRLPILMYHRVAPEGSTLMSRYRIHPEAFEAQMRYLHEAGYQTIRLEEWAKAFLTKQPLPGRAVLITFDDGYLDFFEHAWPILKRYHFTATVFLVAKAVGKSNLWDQIYGEEIPLMGWTQIGQLQAEGVEFGSHTETHTRLTGLSPVNVVSEAAGSREILGRKLKTPVRAFAYPYGETNPAIEHLIGACGYTFGLTCNPGLCPLRSNLLSLPRLEVSGHDDFSRFVSRLNG